MSHQDVDAQRLILERREIALAEPHQIGAHEGGDPLRISGGPISGFGIVIGCGLVTAVDEIPCLGIREAGCEDLAIGGDDPPRSIVGTVDLHR